jgi:hypothetical protein
MQATSSPSLQVCIAYLLLAGVVFGNWYVIGEFGQYGCLNAKFISQLARVIINVDVNWGIKPA